MQKRSFGALCVAAAAGLAAAQADSVQINLSGIVLASPFAPVSRSSVNNPVQGSPLLIRTDQGYTFTVDGTIAVTALVPVFEGPLGDLLEGIAPGNAARLNGFVRAPLDGISPDGTIIWREAFEGDFNGVSLSLTFQIEVTASGEVVVSVVDILLPPLLAPLFSINFTAGSATVSTWAESEPQLTEWHFAGNFESADGSASASLRFADDPAFGPILAGSGDLDAPPASPTPAGLTAAQSFFVDTAADASLPPLPDGDDVVYRTSPAFNEADPGNLDLRRGVGLSMFASLQPAYPGGLVGQWSFVWDILVPGSTFFEGSAPREFLAALVQDDDNNDGGADLWLRNQAGETVVVYAPEGDGFGDEPVPLPGFQPDTWHRLAVSVDEFQTGSAAVYLDGALAGFTSTGFLNNLVDPTSPAYSDGTPVPAALWDQWGRHPSPWAQSPESVGTPVPAPLLSTAGVFTDLEFGGSMPVFLANMAFVDRLLTADEVASLGGPSASGIFLPGGAGPCNPADIAMTSGAFGTLDGNDIGAFVQAFVAGDPAADIAPTDGAFGTLDGNDIAAFVQSFLVGCPG